MNILEWVEERNSGLMEYTTRRNINRGYMKLEVWNDALDLFSHVSRLLNQLDRVDLKLKSQIMDAAQSISANIAEGYCRRSINEYLYFLNVSLGSIGELITRMIGLRVVANIPDKSFESFDELHYKVENKLIALIKSLQSKRKEGTWEMEIKEPSARYNTK
ncbi:MAG: four helix bundle protein [Bacteroidota bacterium]|nr:four helix bundle protein [Bacteroidota bacterium]